MKYRFFLKVFVFFILIIRGPEKLYAMEWSGDSAKTDRKSISSDEAREREFRRNSQDQRIEAARRIPSSGALGESQTVEDDEGDSTGSMETTRTTGTQTEPSDINPVLKKQEKKQEKSAEEQELDEAIKKTNAYIDDWLGQLREIEVRMPRSRLTPEWITPLRKFIESQKQPTQDSSPIEKLIYFWEQQQDHYAKYLDSYDEHIRSLQPRDLEEPLRSYRESYIQRLQAQQYEQCCMLHDIINNYQYLIRLAKEVLQQERLKENSSSSSEVARYDFVARSERISPEKRTIRSLLSRASAPCDDIRTQSIKSSNFRTGISRDLESVKKSANQERNARSEELRIIHSYQEALSEAITWAKDKPCYAELQWRVASTERNRKIVEKEQSLANLRFSIIDYYQGQRYWNPSPNKLHLFEFIIQESDRWASEWDPIWAKEREALKEAYQASKARAEAADQVVKEKLATTQKELQDSVLTLRQLPKKIRDRDIETITHDLQLAIADRNALFNELKKRFQYLQAKYGLTHPNTWSIAAIEARLNKPWDFFHSEFGDDLSWKELVYSFAKANRAREDFLKKEEIERVSKGPADEEKHSYDYDMRRLDEANGGLIDGISRYEFGSKIGREYMATTRYVKARYDTARAGELLREAEAEANLAEANHTAYMRTLSEKWREEKRKYALTKIYPEIRELPEKKREREEGKCMEQEDIRRIELERWSMLMEDQQAAALHTISTMTAAASMKTSSNKGGSAFKSSDSREGGKGSVRGISRDGIPNSGIYN